MHISWLALMISQCILMLLSLKQVKYTCVHYSSKYILKFQCHWRAMWLSLHTTTLFLITVYGWIWIECWMWKIVQFSASISAVDLNSAVSQNVKFCGHTAAFWFVLPNIHFLSLCSCWRQHSVSHLQDFNDMSKQSDYDL